MARCACPLLPLSFPPHSAPSLLPFPTRRSSDLHFCFDEIYRRMVGAGEHSYSLFFEQVSRHARIRSEEHTSELQSQSNLVCRLLLEKKKYKFATLREDRLGGVACGSPPLCFDGM